MLEIPSVWQVMVDQCQYVTETVDRKACKKPDRIHDELPGGGQRIEPQARRERVEVPTTAGTRAPAVPRNPCQDCSSVHTRSARSNPQVYRSTVTRLQHFEGRSHVTASGRQRRRGTAEQVRTDAGLHRQVQRQPHRPDIVGRARHRRSASCGIGLLHFEMRQGGSCQERSSACHQRRPINVQWVDLRHGDAANPNY